MKTVRLVVVIVQRVCITAAVFFAAAVSIHFFAIDPKERAISCDRPCNRADWPRICRFELVVEKRTFHRDRPQRPGRATSDNVSPSNRWTSDEASDSRVVYYAINGRYVGPTLTVCENDFLVVDVENRIPGESISLHWTGQSQRRTPFMDGVPMITQCPIASFTRFQYKFQVDKPGTHLYHGFTGSQRTQGLLGAFIVRSVEEDRFPSSESVWLVTELHGELAVNGQRSWMETIPANASTHRIRLLYTGARCQHWLTLEGHRMKVLAIDGSPLDAESSPSIDRILLHDGLRVDLAIARLAPVEFKPDYEIRFTPVEADEGACERVILRLRYGPEPEPPTAEGDGGENIKYNLISTPQPAPHSEGHSRSGGRSLDLTRGLGCGEVTKTPQDEVLCPQDLPGSREAFPKDLSSYDTRLELTISTRTVAREGPFGEPYRETVHSVNGFTFAFPSVLMLREPANVELRAHTCGGHRHLPRSCHPVTAPCECVHVEHIEAGHRVEMVLINADPATDYVYHLHGQTAFVVGTATGHRTDLQKVALDPGPGALRRDTIVVRRDSIVVLRFVAKNAGLWLLRDIGAPSWSRGLDVVLNVGTHQLAFGIPSNFPACRHFVGPRYFLI